MITLSGRTYLITGATSGIGLGIARILHGLGAKLVLTGRDKGKLERLGEELSSHHHLLRPFELEAGDEIPSWIKSIAAETGPLHGFVHSAGICQLLPVQALNLKRFDRTIRLNLFSAMMIVRGFVQPNCYVKNQSSIVLISSTAGILGCPGQTLYSASKGALIAFAKGAALELAPLGIRVNALSPACVETPMLDQVRQSIPEENYQQLCQRHALGLGQPHDVAQPPLSFSRKLAVGSPEPISLSMAE
ncbi:MAG: SDR family oxidoreductase [Methylacidiphilales bacterium]|nr:SDR family oxidoreductase [Candidatus Methylacidiphilales bacterium]